MLNKWNVTCGPDYTTFAGTDMENVLYIHNPGKVQTSGGMTCA